MTNQVLDFLDIDLGLYVNNFESSSLDSSSSSPVNIFSSNPNLTILNEYNAISNKHETSVQTNELNDLDSTLNKHKNSLNFQQQVHRTHSYSFSSSNSCNSTSTSSDTTQNRSNSTVNKCKTNEVVTTKRAILKYLDKKISKKTETNKPKLQQQPQQLNYSTVQHSLISQQSLPTLSNSYSSIMTTELLNKSTFSGSISSNVSPSSNSSICSSSSSNLNASIDYHNMRQYSDMTIKSQLQQPALSSSLHVDSFLISRLECDKKQSNEHAEQSIMDLFSTNNVQQNQFEELNNITTPTESISQLDFVNTITPPPQHQQQQQQQKKQPLLLPKPAPVPQQQSTYNYSHSIIMPPVAQQSPFISNSQISMMIPTMTNGIMSRSNSQPDLTINNLDSNFTDMIASNYNYNQNYANCNQHIACSDKTRAKVIRRHPSLSYKSSMSEFNEQDECYMGNFFTNINIPYSSLNGKTSPIITNANQPNNTNTDDGLFLGTDALSDFISNCGTLTELFDDLPDLEDLMSLVTFESSSSTSAALSSSVPASSIAHEQMNKTQCDLNLPNRSTVNDCINTNPLSNYYDYCNTESPIINQNDSNQNNEERTTRSAPPSPTPQKKKQRPTNNAISFNKAWNKMTDDEQSKAVEYLTRIINDEMGLREQLEIIRILNPDTKLKPTDTQFIIEMKIIDDDKFKRIKDVIKTYGLFLNEKLINDNSSDCSANSCPQSYQLAKRELRIKRAQQRLKLKHKKDQRQINKETKSGLFSKTEVIPLSQILPEEDIEIDILS